jgi:phosphopantothenoylcysteine decarboxylase/phosphopantothenate--cysteine ligase
MKNKKILLGITGGIAAYKCAHLVRLLVKGGAEVRVIMTPSAEEFVTPQTLSVLSRNLVLRDFFAADKSWNNHVALAEWADLFLIAPLTANTLAKMAGGYCDNLLLAAYLSARSPVMAAPAMDLDMYGHEGVKKNLEIIAQHGVIIIPSEHGELASGLVGDGRMAEPENILDRVKKHFADRDLLVGKTALVNAGPTFEPIDAVRYIGNRSSGKMGYAIAESFAARGVSVTLVSGPVHIRTFHPGIKVIPVQTAGEMHEVCLREFAHKDFVVCTAAVADFRPVKSTRSKIKKDELKSLQIELVRTHDILADMGAVKNGQFLAGFALESDDLKENALKKLKAKNLNLVVANSAHTAMDGDKNSITMIDRHNNVMESGLKSKKELGEMIVKQICLLSGIK